MAFERFWRGHDRDESDRDRSRRGSSERDHREDWGDYGRRFSTGDDQNYERRGWRQGSDYYGNRDQDYGRSNYGQSYSGPEGYGSPEQYRDDYLGNRWREDQRYGAGNFGGRGYSSGGYGRDYEDESSGGAYGSAGYGRDLDYGRRGALGYGGYGGMGGAETGTSAYNAQQEQHRGRGPRGYRRSDERIREDVCDCLTDDARIDASNMEITVKEGEVTLSGTVTSRSDKRRAEDLVDEISGVKDVHNALRVASESRPAEQTATGSQTARH